MSALGHFLTPPSPIPVTRGVGIRVCRDWRGRSTGLIETATIDALGAT